MLQYTKSLLEKQGVFIVDLCTRRWRHNLFAKLNPTIELSSVNAAYGLGTFSSVLSIAKNDLKAVCAVIEPYISTDWNAELGKIYARTFTFRKHTLSAQRIHFFSKKIDYSDLYEISKYLKNAYMGYTVVRPLQSFRTCDTILASPWIVPGRNHDLVHCITEFNPSLLGNDLKVRGMPFIQQDTTAGVCAEADLWMIARYFNKKRLTKRYRIPEITEVATRTNTCGPPREGLNDQQIVDALHNIGLNPVPLPLNDSQSAKASIYSCIESELPVIAGIPEHVFVVVGHDYKQSTVIEDGQLMSDFVESFIVHDDASGPYRKLEISKEVVDLSDESKDSDDNANVCTQRELLKIGDYEIDFLVTALPDRVHMYWDDALEHAKLWLQTIKSVVHDWFPKQKLWVKESLDNLICRVYLRESRTFKSDILSTHNRQSRSKTLIEKYRLMEMPKYIWVIEFARQNDLERIYDRKICGELLLDSTGNRNLADETLLAFTLDGISFIPNEFIAPELVISGKKKYSPLQRHNAVG